MLMKLYPRFPDGIRGKLQIQRMSRLLFIYLELQKNSVAFLVLFFTIFLSACTEQAIYITPEIHGYVYDSKIKKPIVDGNTKIFFNGFFDHIYTIANDKKNGEFTIPAERITYYFIRPSVKSYMGVPAELYIQNDQYQNKIIDYSKFYGAQADEEKRGFSYLTKLDVGIVYLESEK